MRDDARKGIFNCDVVYLVLKFRENPHEILPHFLSDETSRLLVLGFRLQHS